jgi:hypothetical protein
VFMILSDSLLPSGLTDSGGKPRTKLSKFGRQKQDSLSTHSKDIRRASRMFPGPAMGNIWLLLLTIRPSSSGVWRT